jgi:hypothetical protein
MKDELGKFLSNIWGTGGKVFLAFKASPQEFDVPPPKNWPEDKDKVITFVLAAAAQGKDVYFSPAIYKDSSTNKSKANVLKSRALWVDLDGNAAEAHQFVADGKLPAPTYRVGSGREGHEHWYWLLKDYHSVEKFELINKRIAYLVKADHCWDAGRVLRPPFTSNYKKPDNPLAVDIHEFKQVQYELADFDHLPSVNHSIVENTVELGKLGELPTIGDVLATYKWDVQHLDIFNNPSDKKGSRDQSLMRLSFFCANVGMTDEAMYVILDDLTKRMGKFVGRADRERRLAELIAKARVKYPYGSVKLVPTEEEIQQVFTVNDLLHAEFKMEWLVENLLTKGSVNFISAESGIGKSRLSLQMAEALASGTNFLTWPVGRKIKSMFLSLEMDRFMLKHFIESLSKGNDYDEDISENLLLVPVGNPIQLDSEEGTRYVRYLLEEHRPEVMFIDALGSLTFDALGEEQAKAINNKLTEFIAEFGTTFIVIHHNRKPDKGQSKSAPMLGDVYGNQYIVAGGTLVLTMWMPENQSHVELITLKSRARMSDKPIVMDGTMGFQFVFKEHKADDEDSNDNENKTTKFGLF